MVTEYAHSQDGTRIAYEVCGEGPPILFLHEFAGDMSSWDVQVSALSRTHRCIRFNARGYPPSDVPAGPDSYSQSLGVQDAVAVLDAANVRKAHLIGLSMGAYAAANITAEHPERVTSAVIAGGGAGTLPGTRDTFVSKCRELAEDLRESGWQALAGSYAAGPTRVQLKLKDPGAWERFVTTLSGHSSEGSALTIENIQARRPDLYSLIPALSAAARPMLIMTGDEDDGCLEVNLRLKASLRTASWAVLPGSGHAINLEEPALFVQAVQTFFQSVENKTWRPRDSSASGLGL